MCVPTKNKQGVLNVFVTVFCLLSLSFSDYIGHVIHYHNYITIMLRYINQEMFLVANRVLKVHEFVDISGIVVHFMIRKVKFSNVDIDQF